VENALDYFLSAAEYAGEDDVRSLKYSILHAAASVELVLKARLFKEHWSLIFADVDKADEAALRSGDFKSADPQTVIERLEKIAKVKISKGELDNLDELRKLRNCIQHFAVIIKKPQASSLVAKGFNFLIDFCDRELPEVVVEFNDAMKEIKEHLQGIDEYIAVRLKAIKGELDDAICLFTCPECQQYTLRIGVGDPNCPFCGYQTSAGELAESHAESPLEECPQCNEETLSLRLLNNEVGYWLCTSCGYKAESLSSCPRCGKLTAGDGMCQDCWNELLQKD
jgi:ribosomal protein L37AE/L43A